ncbi:FUSC family protein [Lichenicoccus sp.]|uniref:FUSC family protein n=1 Tax=Lichenicoccus sp. TaxID=2781899 RepID=UPI003D104E70
MDQASPLSRTAVSTVAGQALRDALAAHGPTALYCVRTLAAVALALYVAFSLQLEAPSSAAVTVLIVANPVSGALVSKSLWRLLGTLIGAVLAVVLMAAFAQTPLLFFIMFSLCIGAACVVSTLLRYFKAYAAVLAGYTIIIVCNPAFANPNDIFPSALSRVSAVSVGIVSAALVFLLTELRAPSRLTEASLGLIRDTGAALAMHFGGGGGEDREALLTRANGLHEIIEYAAADSSAVARRAGTLRLGAADLMGSLSALHPRTSSLEPGRLADQVARATAALGCIAVDAPDAVLHQLTQARESLAAMLEAPTADLVGLGDVDRAHDLLGRLHDAIVRLTDVAPSQRHSRLRPFLDWPTALRNGARGGIVTMLACLFWYVTQWPSGPTLLAFLVPAACLLATNPSASRASVDFSIGTLLAIPASWFCETFLLSRIDGFPLLIAALGVCLLPGIWLQFHPRHGLRAFGYVVFFNAMIAVGNPIRFNDITLLNGWLAFIIGAASLIVVFRVLLPANATRDSNRLSRALARAAASAASGRRAPDRAVWEYQQMQKVLRLIQRLAGVDAARRQRVTDCALIAVEIGRCVLRLRAMLPGLSPETAECVAAALRAAADLRRDPLAAADMVANAAATLAAQPAMPVQVARAAALLGEIARLIKAIPHFLARDFRLADAG